MRIISEFVRGENDHITGNPMGDCAFALFMAIVAIATFAFGIIVHVRTV